MLNKLGLRILDEEMLPAQMNERENNNYTVDNDAELSESMRSWNKEDHQRRQRIIQIYGGDENVRDNDITERYKMPVESKTFSIIEVEDESLREELPDIAPHTNVTHEGNNNEVGLVGEEIILQLSKFSLDSNWCDFFF